MIEFIFIFGVEILVTIICFLYGKIELGSIYLLLLIFSLILEIFKLKEEGVRFKDE